jgi:hypothetical protein
MTTKLIWPSCFAHFGHISFLSEFALRLRSFEQGNTRSPQIKNILQRRFLKFSRVIMAEVSPGLVIWVRLPHWRRLTFHQIRVFSAKFCDFMAISIVK